MADDMGRGGGPLARVVVSVPMSVAQVERLRRRFPETEWILVEGEPTAEVLAGADGWVSWNLTVETLRAAPKLRWLQTGGAGIEGLPLAELAARGVIVSNARGVHAPNIAEHVLAMMLAFARRLPTLVLAQKERRWRDEVTHREVFELNGQTLLLVGLGEIATAIVPRAGALGMRVEAVRRRPERPVPPGVAAIASLTELPGALGRADHVVLTVPATPSSRALIGAAELAAMRPGAYLYNVGRGSVVDTGALVSALASGHLGGAGLDVVDPEPLPQDSPLWSMEQVLITAHTAGATPRYWDRGVALIERNYAGLLAGEPLPTQVDLDAGY